MIGIDIVDVRRIRALMEKYGERFLMKVLTDSEARYVRRKMRRAESCAGRFAAKEAFFKALGQRVAWRDVEIAAGRNGEPHLSYRGRKFGISISHERDYAVAVVTIEDKESPKRNKMKPVRLP